jgi:hypothetical protein
MTKGIWQKYRCTEKYKDKKTKRQELGIKKTGPSRARFKYCDLECLFRKVRLKKLNEIL